MINNLFRLNYWLAPPDIPPSAFTRQLYACLVAVCCCLIIRLLYQKAARRQLRLTDFLLLAALLATALAALNRFLGLISFARWQVGLPAATAILVWFIQQLSPEREALRGHWQALLAWKLPEGRLSWTAELFQLVLQLLGLAILASLYDWPLWISPLVIAIMSSPRLLPAVRNRHSWMALQALLPLYLLSAVEAAARMGWHISLIPAPIPALILAISVLYAVCYQCFTSSLRWRHVVYIGIGAAIGAVLAWAAWTFVTLRARGVSGSDPYGYIQMALDWAQSGSFLHRFPLARDMQRLGLNTEAALPIGYRLPLLEGELASTVWPAGHSWFLGLLARLLGEEAAYWGTPLAAMLAIVMAGILAYQLAPFPAPALRWCTGLVAALLTATSFEFVRWTLVHMADIPALLFTALCFSLAWLSREQRGRAAMLLAALSGVVLGLAYWVRHTQVAMMLPLMFILASSRESEPWRIRLARIALMGACALLAAVPDLAYHHRLYGSIWIPESNELMHYSLSAIPHTAWLLIKEWSVSREFLLLLPWLGLGIASLLRQNRTAATSTLLWLAAVWIIQAPYTCLRTRDILSLLPVLALFSAVGIIESIRWLSRKGAWAAWLLAALLAALITARSTDVLYLAQTRGFNNFGYMWASQRAEFERLDISLPEDAIVGAELHAGAVDLYGKRQAFQAGLWSAADLVRFMEDQIGRGRAVYLLDDGVTMSAVIAELRRMAELQPAMTLRGIPYYYPGGGSDNRDITLYRVATIPQFSSSPF